MQHNPLNPSCQQDIRSGLSILQTVSNIDDIDLIASHPVRLCFCVVGKPDCSFKPLPIHVKKGESSNIQTLACSSGPSQSHIEAAVSAFLSSNDGGFRELLMNAVGPCGSAHPSQQHVQLVLINCTCLIGFQLKGNSYSKQSVNVGVIQTSLTTL